MVLFTNGRHLSPGRLQIQLAAPAHHDVFQRREHIHQFEMLVNHADSQVEGVLGRTDVHRLSVHKNLTLVGIIDSRNHIHQRRLAAAVFPQQGKDFSLMYFQGDILVGDYPAKGFGQVFQLDCAVQHQFVHSFIRRLSRALLNGEKGSRFPASPFPVNSAFSYFSVMPSMRREK